MSVTYLEGSKVARFAYQGCTYMMGTAISADGARYVSGNLVARSEEHRLSSNPEPRQNLAPRLPSPIVLVQKGEIHAWRDALRDTTRLIYGFFCP
ncbi:MAG: hypothetical protein C4325_03270 [Blastocatellia bacterium]